MKIAYKHLVKYFESVISIDEMSQSLYQLGHEHEIEGNIFDMELTPNRGDCLSLRGLLRDLNVFYKINLDEDIYQKDIENFDFNFLNHVPEICPKISFLKIKIDRSTFKYQEPLNSYFSDLNIKKNNFFTDISNYIAYETGQPTHCYDSSKINNNLSLNKLNTEKDFNTLFDQSVNLAINDLVFKSDNEVVNLAGIMGGKYAACSENTLEVIVECAYFKPEAIIGKSTKYDIQSDAAYKFERGVDPLNHNYALRRFIKIVEQNAKIIDLKICNISDVEIIKNKKIKYDPAKLTKIIGTNKYSSKYKDYLDKLGFEIGDYAHIPSYRSDIESQNDLAEELCRVIGYDNLPANEIKISKNKQTNKSLKEEKIKALLIDNGFFEVINNPFISSKINSSIKLDNPLDSNRKYLRTDLKESLFRNFLYNQRRQKDSIKFFEVSDIYQINKGTNDKEKKIGIIASGRQGKNYRDFSRKIDATYLKTILQQVDGNQNFHFETISQNELGSKIKDKVFYLEFKIEEFSDTIEQYISISKPSLKYAKYKPISDQPNSTRDLSFSIKNVNDFEDIQKIIIKYDNEVLKEKFVFDYYKNDDKKEIKIGFRFIFQSKDKTITDSEVDLIMEDIINQTLILDSVSIPGLER